MKWPAVRQDDDTAVIVMPNYGPGDYVHVLAKILEIDPETDLYTLRLYDKDSEYPFVIRGELIAGKAPVPTPSEPWGDVLVLDDNDNTWRPRVDGIDSPVHTQRWFTTNDVLGDTWENLFRTRGPLRIFELHALTDDPKGSTP